MPAPCHPDDRGARRSVWRFGFGFRPAYRVAGVWFGITPATAEACVGPRELSVRFGPWCVTAALENVDAVEVTGPYALLKTVGPARLAVTDRGLTLATNGDRGVRLGFVHPIRGIEPTGLLRHPELTLTVADVDGFAACVRERAVARRRAATGW